MTDVTMIEERPGEVPHTPPRDGKRDWFGHPRGLTILFLTQTWAEFSYFGLQATLVYYMTGQLGFSQQKSSLVYGLYGAVAFFSPFIGGLICDRWLGRKRGVIIGGLLMMAGHFLMAFEPLLFPALGLVALGNGLFIPPLAVQVGALYRDGDPRQAQAFSAYYMGINLGGFLAPLVCGTLGEFYGWHWGFAAAGIGMAVGIVTYVANPAFLPPEPPRVGTSFRKSAQSFTAFELRDLRLLLAIVATVVLFRVAYEQSGNVIALWVAHQTDRSIDLLGHRLLIPATWFQSINMLIILVGTPLLIRYWRHGDRRGDTATLLRRMSLGCAISTLSMIVMVFAAREYQSASPPVPVSAWWVVGFFVALTLGELLIIPIGLSLIDRLSPARIAAMCMGAWYIAKFVGTLLAGVMGSLWGTIPATTFFAIGATAVGLAGIIFLLMARRTNRLEPAV
jgi:POT family proton-dependent oligopeptide transporter